MGISNNNYHYEETRQKNPITGWHRATIREITEEQRTKAGNATGFFIKLDVRVGNEIEERAVWLSFNHPSEFLVKKSTNIGAMLRILFPTVMDDSEYVGESFWLNFHHSEKNGTVYENFFDYKRNVSLDGKMTLEGKAIDGTEKMAPSSQKPKLATAPPRVVDAGGDGSDEVPF